ncbi:putative Holliday junction resolvase [Clostridium sp. CAG:628]|nr:putative Holliday junction resolvase [Clostridium sp. CAG:628]
MRIIGLDYGSVTCGVALSDESFLIASPMETIRYKEMDELLSKLDIYFSKYEIGVIVLGNPINLDGSISKRSEITLEFKTILENRYDVQVVLEDERLTSVIVNNILIENNTKRENRKKVVDKLAACLILESYLDRRNNGK